MAFAQGRYQPDILPGPQWRQAPLNGIRIAGAWLKGLQLTAVQGGSGPVLGAVSKPRRLDVLAAAGQLGRPRDIGQAHRIGRNLADAQVSAWSG